MIHDVECERTRKPTLNNTHYVNENTHSYLNYMPPLAFCAVLHRKQLAQV